LRQTALVAWRNYSPGIVLAAKSHSKFRRQPIRRYFACDPFPAPLEQSRLDCCRLRLRKRQCCRPV